MADKNLKFTLDFIAKTAGLKDSAQLAEKLGAKLDDSSDSADALAKVMAATADKLEAEMKETAQIAELLGNALGPEMAAKIGQSKIDTIAGEFRAAGLDAKGAEEKIDQLADGVRRLDQVADAAGTLDTKIKDVGKSTDQSRSVMANFTGNAMQEIPGMTGMFGPLNMAVGQFGEYAAEGNIKLGQMAQMAGPMLGVTVAMKLLTDYMKQVAAVKAFNKAEVKAFADSLREGSNVAKDFRDRLEETGKVEFHLNRLFGGDALDSMARAGVTMDQFSAAVFGGKEGIQRLVDAMKAAGVGGGDLADIMLAAQSAQDNYNASVTLATELNKVFGDTDDDVAKVGAALDATTTAATQSAAAAQALADVQQTLTDKALAAAAGMYDVEEATLAADEKYATYTQTIADGDATLSQLRQQQIDQAQGYADIATKIAEEQGVEADSRAGIALQIAALEDMKAKYPLLADEIQRYIDKLNSIPRDIHTNVTSNAVHAGTHAGVGDQARSASGTNNARPGFTLVGEQGPELVRMGGGERVSTADETKSLLDPVAFANVVGPMIARAIRQELRSA